MSSPLLTGPMSRAMRERVWRLVDEVELASRDASDAEQATEEHVAAYVGLAETLELALAELEESLERLRAGAGRLREHAR